MEEEEYDPYLVAFDNIKTEDKVEYQNNIIQEDENMVNEYEINNKINEDVEMKNENNSEGNEKNLINEAENKIQNNEIINNNNEINENTYINNSKINESNKSINIQIPKKIKNDDNKIKQEYDYGYSLIYINGEETGLMEDFIDDKNNESITKDCFNYHLNEPYWIKILNYSIYIHYEKNMKEHIEKMKKMRQIQNIVFNNTNMAGTTGNPILFASMNPFMINQFKTMNINNINNIKK